MRSLVLLLMASVLSAQTISTVVGSATAASTGDGGPATAATVNQPVNVAVDSAGNLYVTDQFGHKIRKIDTKGTITTFAGTGTQASTGDGGLAVNATINTPTCVTVGPDDNVYICEVAGRRVRKVDAKTGIITTVAGTGVQGDAGDGGQAQVATFWLPIRAVVDANNVMYIVDQGNHRVRKVDLKSGIVLPFAGISGNISFSGDNGPATSATFNNPTALALDAAGNVLITDQTNQRIRRVDVKTGIITTIAGSSSSGSFSGDGLQATSATLNYPGCVVVEASGSIVIADTLNWRIRRIGTDGVITTIAGTGARGFAGDNGPALSAQISNNFGITRNAAGDLFFTEASEISNRVRKIAAPSSAGAPVFTAAGVTNAASFVSGISPGTIATIFGTNLSKGVSGVVSAASIPVATTLAGTSVTVGGVAAPIINIVNQGTEQMSILIPFEIQGQTSVPIVVNNGSASSAPVTVPVSAALPGVFTTDGTTGIAVHGADNSLITAANPAHRGEIIVIYATGLGPVTPPVVTGAAAPGGPLATTAFIPSVTIGGASAGLQFSGLTPGLVGLYQINVAVPQSSATGNVDMVVSVNGTPSSTVKIAVQ